LLDFAVYVFGSILEADVVAAFVVELDVVFVVIDAAGAAVLLLALLSEAALFFSSPARSKWCRITIL
jgi:hypothetical protein